MKQSIETKVKQLQDENEQLVVYGAGVVGEVLCRLLQKYHVGNLVAFCDNNQNKKGQQLCGLPILSFSECCEQYSKISFLIAMNDVKYAHTQVDKTISHKIVFTHELLDMLLHAEGEILSDLQPDRNMVKYMLKVCSAAQRYYQNEEKLYVRTLQLLVTERCTLKCAECSNLIQYYEKQKDCDYETLIKTIDVIDDKFDEVSEVHLIGGEPLLMSRLYDVIQYILSKNTIQYIIIFTNGTILPTEEQLEVLKNDRIMIHISNYGALSRKLEEIRSKFSEKGIHYDVYDEMRWCRHSRVQDYQLNEQQLKERLRECRSAVNCVEIGDGCLFRCFYANHAYRLQAVPCEVNEYIHILDEAVTKEEIYQFLYKKDTFQICNWCNGMKFTICDLPPAEQTKKPLEYNKYPY